MCKTPERICVMNFSWNLKGYSHRLDVGLERVIEGFQLPVLVVKQRRLM